MLMEEEHGEITFCAYPQKASYLAEVRENINAAIRAAISKNARKLP